MHFVHCSFNNVLKRSRHKMIKHFWKIKHNRILWRKWKRVRVQQLQQEQQQLVCIPFNTTNPIKFIKKKTSSFIEKVINLLTLENQNILLDSSGCSLMNIGCVRHRCFRPDIESWIHMNISIPQLMDNTLPDKRFIILHNLVSNLSELNIK